MPSANSGDVLPLDYATPETKTRDLPAWIVSISLGATAGYFISTAGWRAVGAAIIAGVFFGIVCAIVARRHRIAFGLLADGAATAVATILVTVRNVQSGYPTNAWETVLIFIPFLFALMAIPSLFCSVLLVLARGSEAKEAEGSISE